MASEIPQEKVEQLYQRLDSEARASGYNLNPDAQFARDLVQSLLVNEQRYGYWSCPCRLAEGLKEEDVDIICPCDYRDDDLEQYGACFCALYVSAAAVRGEVRIKSIPERRPEREDRKQFRQETKSAGPGNLAYPVWRCKVCGYLCARENPPEVCPVCKAKKERFERFI
jgi:ferredoxin-thioredoxin reductase catalytic subunit/rubredoxin